MAGTAQDTNKNIPDNIQIAQRQVTFIQLTIFQTFIDDAAHRVFDSVHVGFADSPHCRLTSVRQHDQGSFTALRFRAVITKIFFNDTFAVFALCRLLVKV